MTITGQNLSFFDQTDSPVFVQPLSSNLVEQSGEFTAYKLSFEVSYEIYLRISSNTLFNLQPELQTNAASKDFEPENPVQIDIVLHPDHLHLLLEHATTSYTAFTHLQTLSHPLQIQETIDPNTISPLLKTENWFALTVTQIREDSETGYSTLWNYIDLTHLQDPEAHTDQLTNGITQFFTDCTEQYLTDGLQDLADGILTNITSLFDNLANEFDPDTIAKAAYPTTQKHPILNALTTFFNNEDWAYLKLKNATLQLAYEGNNGAWNCYVKAREAQQQIVFYSISPVPTPEDKRQAIAEFITRANYGTILGNFELDFNDGEIRYKTSLDIEGVHEVCTEYSRLTTALIRNLVYSNLMMMDQYLPGICAVIEQNTAPQEAVQAIEVDLS